MGEPSPAFSWYPRDWFASGAYFRLSLEAQAAYRNLLDHAWEKDGIENDPETLQRFARATRAEWKRIWPQIKRYFVVDPESRRLRSPRQEIERAKQRARSSKAAESARVRWTSAKGKTGRLSRRPKDANAMRSHSEGNAEGMLARAITSSSALLKDTERSDQVQAELTPEPDPVVVSAPRSRRPTTTQDIENDRARRMLAQRRKRKT